MEKIVLVLSFLLSLTIANLQSSETGKDNLTFNRKLKSWPKTSYIQYTYFSHHLFFFCPTQLDMHLSPWNTLLISVPSYAEIKNKMLSMDRVLNNKIDNQAREIAALQDEITALRTDHADLEVSCHLGTKILWFFLAVLLWYGMLIFMHFFPFRMPMRSYKEQSWIPPVHFLHLP